MIRIRNNLSVLLLSAKVSIFACFLAFVSALTPHAAQAQSATLSASPSTFSGVGDEITFTYTIQPGSYFITSISGTSQIKGVPITCQAPNDNNPFTCTSVYTADALDEMSGTFSDFAVFTGNRIGGTFNITSPTLAVAKSGGGPVVISVSSSPRPTQAGEPVTVQATISSMGCNAGLMPPGSLQLSIGSDSRTLPLVAEFPYSTSGTVSFTTSALANGSYPISASYAGGGGCTAGTTTGQAHIVEPRPSVSVSANAQSGASQSFDINFSAPVSGLTPGEISVASAAGPVTRSLTGSGTSYLLTLTGMTQSGTISVAVPGSVAQTAAGSQNLATTNPALANYSALPVVSSVSPNSGSTSGGTTVTITGSAFTDVTAVTFGGQSATAFTVNSATSITATTPATVPADTPGSVSILVTTSGGTNASNSLFSYKSTQSITFTAPADIASYVANQQVALVATTTSGLPISFASITPMICSVSGSTATVLAAGTCTVTADQPGDDTYEAALQASRSFEIDRADQSTTFLDPADIISFIANQNVTLIASATSGLPVSFASTTPEVCSVAGNTATVLAAGICMIEADQAGSGNYNPAPQTSQSFTIGKADQSITFTDLVNIASFAANQNVTLTATASSGLTVSFTSSTPMVCSVSGTTATVLAAGTCTVNAEQAGDGNYNAATQVSRSFSIGRADQDINFTDPADIAAFVENQNVPLTATATSELTVSFASTTPTVCSVTGTAAIVLTAGTCTVAADQAGDGNYNAAAQVSQSFTIGQADQNITFTSTAPNPAAVNGATYAVSANGGASSNPVAFSIDAESNAVCTIAGNVVSFIAEGSCVVNANQAGDISYNAAPKISQTIAVDKQVQVIAFTSAPPAAAVVGGLTYAVSATGGNSGNPVVFSATVGSAGVCTVSGSTVSFTGQGTCVINASQAGDTVYADAQQVQQSFAVAANTAPTANAGPDQTAVTPGGVVTLDGSGSSDPDAGQVLSFAWLQIAGATVELSSSTVSQPTFTAPLLGAGVVSEALVFQLTVDDGNGGTSVDTVTITTVDNIPPTVTIAGLPSEVSSGSSFMIAFIFSEPVTGFEQGDILVTNAIITGFTGSEADYTASFVANGAGAVSLSIAAGAAEDMAGNPSVASGTVTAALTATIETEALLAEEALARNRALLASQPDLTRFMSHGGRSRLDVSSQGTALNIDIVTDPSKTVWMTLTGRRGTGDAALDKYVHGTLGAHLMQSDGLIVGAMIQADHGVRTDGIGKVEADGWLVGPYFVARLGESNLSLSGSLLAGKTQLAVNPIGTYTDQVTSDRRLLTFSLVDEVQIETVILRPRIDIANVAEKRPAYVDGLGNIIAAGDVALTEASFGVDFETPFSVASGTARLLGGLSAISSAEHVSNVSERSSRGRIDLGLSREYGHGGSFNLSVNYDGIGAAEKGSVGLEALYSLRF